MPVFVYKNGKWRTLAGKKIAKDGAWKQPGDDAKFYLGGVGHKLGYGALSPASLPAIPEIPETPEMPGIPAVDPLSFVPSTQPATGTAWYITPNGNGDMDGTSWANAAEMGVIHAIMLMASSGDYICFAEGDYSIDYTITLKSGVSLYGGFTQASEYAWASRDVFSNPTKFTVPSGGTYAWLACPASIAGQIVDGFYIDGHNGIAIGEGDVACRNMYVIRGTGTFTGALTNAVLTGITNTSVIGGNCEDVHCSACAAVTISGTATDCHFRNMTGTVTVSGASTDCTVASSKAVSFNDTATGCIVHSNTGNVVFGNNDTITECQAINITGTVLFSNDAVDCIVHTVSGLTTVSRNATGMEVTNGNISIGGYAEELTVQSGNVNITGNATDLTVTSGDVSVAGSITNAAISGSCICNGNMTGSKVTGNTQTSSCSVSNTVSNSTVTNCAFKAKTASECKIINCDLGYYGASASIKTLFYNCTGVNAASAIKDSNGNASTGDSLIGTSDSSVPCNYRIVDGKLEFYNGMWISADSGSTGWTAISGYSGSSDYAYGIRNGALYRLSGTTASAADGGSTGWTAISGYSSSTTHYAYGIRNGALYMLSGTTASAVDGGSTGWTAISGFSRDTTYYAYGIRNGALYRLSSTAASAVDGGSTGWTAISGFSYANSSYAYGIRNGALYMLSGTTAYAVAAGSTGWTAISGYSYSASIYAYGIRNGALYRLSSTTVSAVDGGSTGWTATSGYSDGTSSYAYGIRNGILYRLNSTIATTIDYYCTAVYGFGYSSHPAVYRHGDISNSTAAKSVFLNCTSGEDLSIPDVALVGSAENCLFANCEITATTNANLASVSAKSITAVNSIGSIPAGSNNVFWNNTGTINPAGNAQSEYDEDNALTLGTNNLITKFTQTGYYPAKGKQDIGACPDPDTQAESFALWVQGFGNWVPLLTSFMHEQGTYDSELLDDLRDVVRPNPPTFGAYEPISETITANAEQSFTGTAEVALSDASIVATAENSGELIYAADSAKPAWATVNSSTGAITGTPSAAGTGSFVVTVSAIGALPVEVTVTYTIS